MAINDEYARADDTPKPRATRVSKRTVTVNEVDDEDNVVTTSTTTTTLTGEQHLDNTSPLVTVNGNDGAKKPVVSEKQAIIAFAAGLALIALALGLLFGFALGHKDNNRGWDHHRVGPGYHQHYPNYDPGYGYYDGPYYSGDNDLYYKGYGDGESGPVGPNEGIAPGEPNPNAPKYGQGGKVETDNSTAPQREMKSDAPVEESPEADNN